nr:hypothetical protein HUO10_000100 [Paraburkholderia busanensis]
MDFLACRLEMEGLNSDGVSHRRGSNHRAQQRMLFAQRGYYGLQVQRSHFLECRKNFNGTRERGIGGNVGLRKGISEHGFEVDG